MVGASVPAEAFVAETLEQEFKLIQPQNFWTTVRDAAWPSYPAVIGPPSALLPNPAMLESEEQHSVRLWSPMDGMGTSRPQNNVELTIAMNVLVAWVVKDKPNLARQIFFARADMRNLMQGNKERMRPNYTGQNDWGLTTLGVGTLVTDYLDDGIAVVWGTWSVEFRFKLPKG